MTTRSAAMLSTLQPSTTWPSRTTTTPPVARLLSSIANRFEVVRITPASIRLSWPLLPAAPPPVGEGRREGENSGRSAMPP